MAYADRTEVSPEKSRQEIESTLKRYGATHFAFISTPNQGIIAFQVHSYQIRIAIKIPPLAAFLHDKGGRKRPESQLRSAQLKEERRLWRALTLCVKAKLEAVQSGITTFEQEFMAHIVLPGTGETVGESLLPKVREAVESNAPYPALEWKP